MRRWTRMKGGSRDSLPLPSLHSFHARPTGKTKQCKRTHRGCLHIPARGRERAGGARQIDTRAVDAFPNVVVDEDDDYLLSLSVKPLATTTTPRLSLYFLPSLLFH